MHANEYRWHQVFDGNKNSPCEIVDTDPDTPVGKMVINGEWTVGPVVGNVLYAPYFGKSQSTLNYDILIRNC